MDKREEAMKVAFKKSDDEFLKVEKDLYFGYSKSKCLFCGNEYDDKLKQGHRMCPECVDLCNDHYNCNPIKIERIMSDNPITPDELSESISLEHIKYDITMSKGALWACRYLRKWIVDNRCNLDKVFNIFRCDVETRKELFEEALKLKQGETK